MDDLNGQRLLLLMQQRPIPECDIEEIVQLFGDHCHFVDNWENLDDSIMKVFGKKAAEREAVQRHLAMIQRSGAPHFIIAKDEVRMSGSHAWRDAASDVTNFIDRNCREPPRLLIYKRAVVRFCRNMDSKLQGTLGVIEYQNSTPNSVAVFIASLPSEINENLRTGEFRNWRRVSVRRQNGFTQSFRGNSVRRQQMPLVNYRASNCHRLLGDELPRLATAISTTESKYALWLPSQIFVIGSRVPALNRLYFVGRTCETLQAITCVLKTRNLHEERVYKFFETLRLSNRNRVLVEISSTPFMRAHFSVPTTSGGFVSVLVSLKDRSLTTLMIEQTDQSLAGHLRQLNCTAVEGSQLYAMQPWTVGAYIWNFESEQQRTEVFRELQTLRRERPQWNHRFLPPTAYVR